MSDAVAVAFLVGVGFGFILNQILRTLVDFRFRLARRLHRYRAPDVR
jgi:hypothetical protein